MDSGCAAPAPGLQVAIQARVIDMFVKGQQNVAPALYGTHDAAGWVESFDEYLDAMQERHNHIYLGFDTPRRLENQGG